MDAHSSDPAHKIHAASAIHLLVKNIPTAHPNELLGVIEENVTQQVKTYESIDYIYVVNEHNQLVGVLSLRDLIALRKDVRIKDVMITNVVSVHPHSHREHVALLALKHNIKAVPVIDKEDKFLGVITSDVILKIAHDELTEDLLLLEGIHIKEYSSISTLKNNPFHLLGKRLPWLLLGLIGGLAAAKVIGFFEMLLAEEVVLISFLPLMVYMSDAVGSQSQTIFIRSLALDSGVNILKYLIREIFVATLIAICLGVLLLIFITITHRFFLGFVLSVSLFFTVLVSVIIAVLIPWILIKLKKDPAIGSGPFATILRDILSIVIYFSISQILFMLP